jgi:hypothetical protein
VHADAGTVHQSVDPLVPAEGGGHQVADLRRVGHVGGHGQGPVELGAQGLQPVGTADGQHRVGPGGMQQAGGGRADTGGRAGDDHRLAGQVNEIGHEPSLYPPGYWDAAIIEASRAAGCTHVLSEDLSDGQDYGGVQVTNPFR